MRCTEIELLSQLTAKLLRRGEEPQIERRCLLKQRFIFDHDQDHDWRLALCPL